MCIVTEVTYLALPPSVLYIVLCYKNTELLFLCRILIERRGKTVQNLIVTNDTTTKLWKRETRRDVSHDHASDSYLFTNFVLGPRQRRAIDNPPPKANQSDSTQVGGTKGDVTQDDGTNVDGKQGVLRSVLQD